MKSIRELGFTDKVLSGPFTGVLALAAVAEVTMKVKVPYVRLEVAYDEDEYSSLYDALEAEGIPEEWRHEYSVPLHVDFEDVLVCAIDRAGVEWDFQ